MTIKLNVEDRNAAEFVVGVLSDAMEQYKWDDETVELCEDLFDQLTKQISKYDWDNS